MEGASIRHPLRVCRSVFDEGERKTCEYMLFEQLALIYLTPENYHNYPKAVGIYEYMKKLKSDKKEDLDKSIDAIEKRFCSDLDCIATPISKYIEELKAYRNDVKEILKLVNHEGMEQI
jgi:hypothetical protein